ISCSFQPEEYEDYIVSEKNIRSIELNKIRSFTIKTGDRIIGDLLTHFAVSKDGQRMAFYDILSSHMLITDNQGHILYSIGKKGKGPQEFVQVRGWNFDEQDNLIIFDEAQRQLKIFKPDGQLRKILKIFDDRPLAEASPSLFAYNGLIYLSTFQLKYASMDRENVAKSQMIAVFDYKGNFKKLLGRYDPYTADATYYGTAPIFVIDFVRHTIYATHDNSYRIQVFNLQTGSRTAYFGYRHSQYKESEEVVEYYYPKAKIIRMTQNLSFPDGIFITSNYILFYFENLS